MDNKSISNSTSLWIVLIMNLVLVIGLVIVGFIAHSLGVLAAAADYLGDAGGVTVSLLSIWISHHPKGSPRASIYGAFINGSWLLLLTVFVVVEALRRLIHGTPVIHGLPVLITSAIAAVVMFIGAFILIKVDHSSSDEGVKLNARAVLIDTAGDGVAAAGIAVSGGIIAVTHKFYWLDSLIALVIAAVIGINAILLLRTVIKSLRKTNIH